MEKQDVREIKKISPEAHEETGRITDKTSTTGGGLADGGSLMGPCH
jgi:hypothetical protein